jgi:hypothetical protein
MTSSPCFESKKNETEISDVGQSSLLPDLQHFVSRSPHSSQLLRPLWTRSCSYSWLLNLGNVRDMALEPGCQCMYNFHPLWSFSLHHLRAFHKTHVDCIRVCKKRATHRCVSFSPLLVLSENNILSSTFTSCLFCLCSPNHLVARHIGSLDRRTTYTAFAWSCSSNSSSTDTQNGRIGYHVRLLVRD